MVSEFDYDLVVIGAGSGGVRASRFAAQQYGIKAAIIELPFGFVSSDDVGGAGGTCVIRGCVPKKLLVYGSQFAEEFKDAIGFGWKDSVPAHNWKTLISSKGKEIQRLNGVYMNILKGAGVDYYEGRGKVTGPQTVEVKLASGDVRTLKARHVLVATGGHATKLNIPGKEHGITSDEALSLDDQPGSQVVIIGAGYIACEFAGIFTGLGTQVHQMFRKQLVLNGFDEECRAQVQENLAGRGVTLHPNTLPTKIEKNGEHDYVVHVKSNDGVEGTIPASLVMFATGRKPRTYDLGLEALGVQLDDVGAVKVDEFSRTNVPWLWAIGDATNRINLTPVALMEGMAFAHSAFGEKLVAPDYQFVPSAVFCSPPLGSVGFSEEEAVKTLSGEIDVYVSRFKPMKYTISGRNERTLMKLLVHVETDRVVGAHMVGPDAPEIIQGLAIAFKCGATKAQFDSTVGVHPSAAEEFVTMRAKTRRVACTGTAKL